MDEPLTDTKDFTALVWRDLGDREIEIRVPCTLTLTRTPGRIRQTYVEAHVSDVVDTGTTDDGAEYRLTDDEMAEADEQARYAAREWAETVNAQIEDAEIARFDR